MEEKPQLDGYLVYVKEQKQPFKASKASTPQAVFAYYENLGYNVLRLVAVYVKDIQR